MKIENRIDKEQNIIYIKNSGTWDLETVISTFEQILSDPKFNRDMNCIIDQTDLIGSYSEDTYKNLFKLEQYIETKQKEFGNCKWAVINPKDVTGSLARMVIAETKGISMQIKIFDDFDSGFAWVNDETD